MLLETRGKVIFVIKWQKIWLKCLCPSVLWKADLVNDKIRDLAENISKRSVEGEARSLLTAYNNV